MRNIVVTLDLQRTGLAGVAERIDARLKLLREWMVHVPPGQAVPKNLAAAACWHQPELGILPIHSPNEFTRTHPVHGAAITEIGDMIKSLCRSNPTFTKAGVIRPAHGQSARQASDDKLVQLASQWHSERDARLASAAKLRRLDEELLVTKSELAEEKALVETLKRRLSGKHVPVLMKR